MIRRTSIFFFYIFGFFHFFCKARLPRSDRDVSGMKINVFLMFL